jgi:hypothetical protein
MMNREQPAFVSTPESLPAESLETADLTRQQLVKEMDKEMGERVKIVKDEPVDLTKGIEVVNPDGTVGYLDFSNPGIELVPGRPLSPDDEDIDGLTEEEIVKNTGLAGGMVLSAGKDYSKTHPFDDDLED